MAAFSSQGYTIPQNMGLQTAAPGAAPPYGTTTTGYGAAGAPPAGAAGGDLGSAIMGSLGGGGTSLGNDLNYSNWTGGTPGIGGWSLKAGNGYMGGALHSDPTQAQISPDILNSMQQYSDAAYQNATRTLDPQWQQQQQQFAQQMVSQGLQPGTQAYDAAMADFSRSKNDAYSQARDQAMQQGLQAQGQSFQEGLANSNLANEIERARIGAGAQVSAAGLGAQASEYGSDASMHNADVNALTNRMLGLGNLGIEYGNLQNNTNSTDFGILNGLTGQMTGQDIYNNTIPGQQIGNFNQLYQDVPHGPPTPIDVTGAYQMNQNGQLAGYNAEVQNSNSQNQMLGALGTAAIMAMMM